MLSWYAASLLRRLTLLFGDSSLTGFCEGAVAAGSPSRGMGRTVLLCAHAALASFGSDLLVPTYRQRGGLRSSLLDGSLDFLKLHGAVASLSDGSKNSECDPYHFGRTDCDLS